MILARLSDNKNTRIAKMQIIPTYISDLKSITGYHAGWVENRAANAAICDGYEMLKNDAEVAHGMHYMSLQACGEKVIIETKNEPLKKVVNWMLSKIHNFVHVRKSIAYSSLLFGLGIMKKTYTPVSKGLIWEVSRCIQEIDVRRFRIEYNMDNKTEQYWTYWHPKYDAYVVLEDRQVCPDAEIAVQDFVWSWHEFEETSPYFRGFGEVLYPLVAIKQKLLANWTDLCEAWARPFLVGLMDIQAGTINSSAGHTLNEKVTNVLDAFEQARKRRAIVIDSRDKLEYKEMGNVGNNILQEFLKYIDSKISMLIIGSELATSMPKASGSYALGKIHESVTSAIIGYNRQRLAEALKRDVIDDFVIRNKENFFVLGIDTDTTDMRVIITTFEEQLKEQMIREEGLYTASKKIEGLV
jgi:hypothetical protein